jgi:hypothetical protein
LARKTTVVTPQRFSKGFTYSQYLAQIKVNTDRFQQYYDDFSLKPKDAEYFRKAAHDPKGPAKVLALGEDWCPDVYRGLPTMARVAEAAGLEMRVFPRDQNLDIMDEFLKDGKYQSIPVFVFYTLELRYLCHWIERPASATQEMEQIEAAIRSENPGMDDRQFGLERRNRVTPRFPAWQLDTVRELKELLGRTLRTR